MRYGRKRPHRKRIAGAISLPNEKVDTEKWITAEMAISPKRAARPYFFAPGVEIDSEFYRDTVETRHFLPRSAHLKPDGSLYQQDNDPSRASEYSRKCCAGERSPF